MINEKRKWLCSVIGFVVILAIILACICSWIDSNLGIELNELIYTIISPLKGSNMDVVGECTRYCIPKVLCILIIIMFAAALDSQLEKKAKKKYCKCFRILMIGSSVMVLFLCLKYIDVKLKVIEYIKARSSATLIYEEYFVDPNDVEIVNENKKKNLIYIYLESMENSYATVEAGGAQAINYIPNLTELAEEYISFSQTNKLGGFSQITGATWTMGALFATTTGVPFSFPTAPNSMDQREVFASGITALGDVLVKEGYTNEFLCGSNAEFGGRETYFTQHGNYEIFDLYTAREKGYIADNYYVWWGFEDEILYQIAKDEILRLAETKEPFNFTMLTVDTHYQDGYICGLCNNEYPEVAANVVACADRQLKEFITWCQQQDFYEDTVIVITGDHPRMDKALVDGLDSGDRQVYNCFINCEVDESVQLTDRAFSSVDIFPTVLSALGYRIEGDRLGLGTNLFSQEKTLVEILGYQKFNQEISKYSKFYLKNFS